jgi:transglutaminase-like putative cysteine protease
MWKPEDSFYQQADIFYSDARVSYFDTDLPKINSELKIKYETITDDPRYFSTIYFSESYPLKNGTVEIIIPNWFKAEIKEFNFDGFDIKKSIEQKSDSQIIIYKIADLLAIKKEYLSRGTSYTYPHIILLSQSADGPTKETYFTNLQQQYNWYKSLITPETDLEIVKSTALEITKTAKTDEEKIALVYYWIQDHVRYIAFENGIAGFKPAFASEVLNKKFGDCKGMANLACQMLKSLGLDARLCWLGTNHLAYNYSTPSLSVDNHMICAVIKNGKTTLIDPTESYLSINENAERIQNREILIENGENYILYKNHERKHDQNLMAIHKDLKIEGDNLVGKTSYLMKGESKSSFLSNYYGIKSNNSENALLNYLADDDVNYQITINKQPDFLSYHNDITINYDLNFKNGVSRFDNDIYVDLDHDKEFKLFKVDTANRKSDVFFSAKYDIQHETNLQIPTGYNLKSKPESILIDNNFYTLKADYFLTKDIVTYRKQVIIKNTHIKKELINQLNKDFLALSNFYQETLTLSKQ